MTDYIVEYVYYYPPSNMIPSKVTYLSTDYTGMVVISFVNQSPIQQIEATGNSYTINITPQAYVTWYNDQLQYINASNNASEFTTMLNALNSPTEGYATQILATENFLSTEGYYFIPYSQKNNYINAVGSNPIDPSVSYGLTTDNLYVLIKSATSGKSNTGGYNLVQGSILQNTSPQPNKTPNQAPQYILTIPQNQNVASTSATNNQIQQLNDILTPPEINQQTGTGEAVTTANNAAKGISNWASQQELPILFVVGAVAVSIIGIAVIMVFK